MINWINNSSFEIDGYRLTLDWAAGGSKRASSDRDFTMMKGRDFIDHYTKMVNTGIEKVLEVGVYQGGSVVFLDKLLRPKKFCAIELSEQAIPALDKYARNSGDRVNIYYGTSQDNAQAIEKIIRQDFDGQVDFVVDDASHWYEYSKATFMAVFPHVKPGGYYFIEDWSWSFQPDFQKPSNGWFNQNSLANLAIDLMEDMVNSDAIDSIEVVRQMIKVRRSSAPSRPVFETTARRSRQTNLL
ncbi:class I SAM-dependent methyltransferase [Mesorhizobium sp. AR07]|uniref:class I SAM-dependent methyltransferase n=1 Tax=Mesorhizobium sp. AR07 TaxID=2865838 RepID=UPI00215EE53F|nr:class I SAM-dependent methyltransferase [Mesorhizobium sp. AR07]UVK44423.1 class I SAM-dependent methyltransferase [Mesorhizobium sp. AR07]